MIISLPAGQGCEVQLVGTHDAIYVRHNGDNVVVREHVETHNNEGVGTTIYVQGLNPITADAPPDNNLLNVYEVGMLIALYGVDVSWRDREVTLTYASNKFVEVARDDSKAERKRVLCSAMTTLAMLNSISHSTKG